MLPSEDDLEQWGLDLPRPHVVCRTGAKCAPQTGVPRRDSNPQPDD